MFRILASLALCGLAACYPCTYNFGGDNYDASSLANPSTDYQVTAGDATFFLNICQPTVTATCGSNVAVCQTWSGGQASLGAADTAQFNPPNIPGVNGKGFTIQFTGGTTPPSGGFGPRSMEIDMICNPDAGVGQPSYGGEQPQLHYNFQWQSKYACPSTGPSPPGPPGPPSPPGPPGPPSPPGPPGSPGKKGGISGGTVFLIILICLAVTYIGAGIAWNHFKAHNTGVDLIPNVGFWTSLPGLVWDGIKFIIAKIRGLRGGGSYSTL